MEISANAKINLTLDILRRREDGYHDLQMVMQSVSLADELTVTPAQGGVGTAVSDLHFLPTGGKNLAQMAAAAFRQAVGAGGEVDVSIRKHVPVCAGLAGGSADAAAVLHAMNRLTGAGLSPVELAKIGERVGSDVPFCVLGGAALAQGRGELLTPLAPLPPCHIVICKPPFSLSTPQLFARVNVRKIVRRPDTAGVTDALARTGNHDPVCVDLADQWFPTKEYDGFSLPAGQYRALRVTIGAGEGRNWWCVVFPPLCLASVAERSVETAAGEALSQDQVALITGRDGGYVLKFKLIEWWEELMKGLGG